MQFLVPPPPPPTHFKPPRKPQSSPSPKPTALKTALHSGDSGDVIYSLPALRVLRPDILYLCKESRHRAKPRDEMTSEKAESLASLLRIQPYIREVRYTDTIPPMIDLDLNRMRNGLIDAYDHWRTLSGWHLWEFKIDPKEDRERWLSVDYSVKIKDKPVVISRSPRYHNLEFPWTKVMKRYADMAIFVGLPAEHEDFQNRFGRIDYYPTATFLDLARIIAGSELFIGNQSAPRAVAEGLKVSVLVEGFALGPNTHFIRPGATYVYAAEKTQLPDVGDPAKKPKPTIVLSGPVEELTGFGQLFSELCRGLDRHGMNVQLNPWLVGYHLVKPPDDLMSRVASRARPDVLVATNDHLLKEGSLKGGEIVVTMWESTRMMPKVVEQLSKHARVVVVPTAWNAAVLDASGCNVPVRIMPLGIDTKIFKLGRIPGTKGVVSFGIAGRAAHGKIRKGFALVAQAFLKAFPDEKDVRLNFKLHGDCKVERIDDPRIIYACEYFDWPKLVEWYRSNTAYVSGSSGEGWGLHLHQSMAVGCCPIAGRYGGQAEFFDADVGRPVEFKPVRASEQWASMGSWAELSEQSLIDQMRWVYENKAAAVKLGRKASVRATQYTWERTVIQLTKIIDEFGLSS